MHRRSFIGVAVASLSAAGWGGCDSRGIPRDQNADSEASTAATPTVTQGRSPGISATVERALLQRETGLLTAKVMFRNHSPGSRWLVANEFVFVFQQTHERDMLDWRQDGNVLTIDLAQLPPTEDGIHYYRGEEGSFGPVPVTVELPRGTWRYFTYAFQAGVLLDRRHSTQQPLEIAGDVNQLQLRFGISAESEESFRNRVLNDSRLEIREWQRLLTEEWQMPILTDPANIEIVERLPLTSNV